MSNAQRIQRAITGLIIPMMTIPKLYKFAEQQIKLGANDDQLRADIKEFLHST